MKMKTNIKIPFTITYAGTEKLKNEKTRLLINASTKKIPEQVRMFVVVLGKSKTDPIIRISVNKRKEKLPTESRILFSPL